MSKPNAELGPVRIVLGYYVRDTLTGFEGVVTGRCEYLFGCVWLEVTPKGLTEDGKPMPGVWLDEERFELIKEQKITPRKKGGPPSASSPGARPNFPRPEIT